MFVIVWFCISSSLAFLLMAVRINLMRRFLLCQIICVAGDPLVRKPFFWKIFQFLSCFICSAFDRQLCQKCDERGRNFMCERTLPSLLLNLNAQIPGFCVFFMMCLIEKLVFNCFKKIYREFIYRIYLSTILVFWNFLTHQVVNILSCLYT